MISDNKKLNIILGVISGILLIVIVFLISYRNNIESTNVYFNVSDIKNITWKSDDAEFSTDGKTFTFKKNDEVIYNNQEFKLDTHTGMIIQDVLYLRSTNDKSILIWYNEAEYKLDKVELIKSRLVSLLLFFFISICII